MIWRILAFMVVLFALLFFTGPFKAEGILRGLSLWGRLAVSVRGRVVVLGAHSYRPGRTYFCLSVR